MPDILGMAPCFGCGRAFSFDPDDVPVILVDPSTGMPADLCHCDDDVATCLGRSVRFPVCPDCMQIRQAALRVLTAMFERTQAKHYVADLMTTTELDSGSIYPVLARLERIGLVSSDWDPPSRPRGPRRRHYRLTEAAVSRGAPTGGLS